MEFNSNNIYYAGDIININNKKIKLISSYPKNLFGINKDIHNLSRNDDKSSYYGYNNSRYYNYTNGYYIKYDESNTNNTLIEREVTWSYSDYIYIYNFDFIKIFNGNYDLNRQNIDDKGIEIYDINYQKIKQYNYRDLAYDKNYSEGYYIGPSKIGAYISILKQNDEWAYSEYIDVTSYRLKKLNINFGTGINYNNAHVELYDSNKKIINNIAYDSANIKKIALPYSSKLYLRFSFYLKNINEVSVYTEDNKVLWKPKTEDEAQAVSDIDNIDKLYKSITLEDNAYYIRFSFLTENESDVFLKNYKNILIWHPSALSTDTYMNRVDVALQKLNNLNIDIENDLLYKNYIINKAIKYNEENTEIVFAKDYAYSDYIDVRPYDVVYFNHGFKDNGSTMFSYETYDSNKKRISVYQYDNFGTINIIDRKLSRNISFIRFTFYIKSEEIIKMDSNNIVNIYNPDEDIFEEGKALYYDSASSISNIVNDQNWGLSDFINISNNDKINIDFGFMGYNNYCYEFYDDNFMPLKAFRYPIDNDTVSIDINVLDIRPIYIRFCFFLENIHLSRIYSNTIVYYPESKKIDLYLKTITSNINDMIREIDLLNDNILYSNYYEGQFLKEDGRIDFDDNWGVSKPIYVEDNKKIIINYQYDIPSPDKYLIFYDKDLKILDKKNYDKASTIEAEVPMKAFYVKISFYLNGSYVANIENDKKESIWSATTEYLNFTIDKIYNKIATNICSILDIKNKIAYNNFIGEKSINEQGELIDTKDWGVSRPIYIDSTTKKIFVYYQYDMPSPDKYLIFYDKDNNILSKKNYNTAFVLETDIPDDTFSIRVSFYLKGTEKANIKNAEKNIIWEVKTNSMDNAIDDVYYRIETILKELINIKDDITYRNFIENKSINDKGVLIDTKNWGVSSMVYVKGNKAIKIDNGLNADVSKYIALYNSDGIIDSTISMATNPIVIDILPKISHIRFSFSLDETSNPYLKGDNDILLWNKEKHPIIDELYNVNNRVLENKSKISRININDKGNITNIDKTDLITNDNFKAKFDDAVGKNTDIVKKNDIKDFITEDNANTLISNATIEADKINFSNKTLIDGNFIVNQDNTISLNAINSKISGISLKPINITNPSGDVLLEVNNDFYIISSTNIVNVKFPDAALCIGKIFIIKNIGTQINLIGVIVSRDQADEKNEITINIYDNLVRQYMSNGEKWFEI